MKPEDIQFGDQARSIRDIAASKKTAESYVEVGAGSILKTENPKWGFYGTIKTAVGDKEAKVVWDAVFDFLSGVFLKDTPETIRNYLDSAYGRHFADAIIPRDPEGADHILGNLDTILQSRDGNRMLKDLQKDMKKVRDNPEAFESSRSKPVLSAGW